MFLSDFLDMEFSNFADIDQNWKSIYNIPRNIQFPYNIKQKKDGTMEIFIQAAGYGPEEIEAKEKDGYITFTSNKPPEIFRSEQDNKFLRKAIDHEKFKFSINTRNQYTRGKVNLKNGILHLELKPKDKTIEEGSKFAIEAA